MNKIAIPAIDDNAAITAVANDHELSSHPHLLPLIPAIQAAYAQYRACSGNALSISSVALTAPQIAYLKMHYTQPPPALDHIRHIRDMGESRICPMCGSFQCGTIDHFLPRKTHAVFSVFSLNLVPACKCNIKRKATVVGTNSGERLLHPYFDDCLADRLIVAKFDDLGVVPKISVALTIANSDPLYAPIYFHFRTIVLRTKIVGYLSDRWASLCRKPSLIVRGLAKGVTSVDVLRDVLIEELCLLDDCHQAKNNWNSVFVAGLLEDTVLDWLYARLNQPASVSYDPP